MQTQPSSFAPLPSSAPLHALPRKFLEPVLYLADRITHVGSGLREARAMLRDMAQSIGMADYPEQHWFRGLDDQRACELLNVDTAKKGALVLLALLIKCDPKSGEAHRNFFTRVRTKMGAEPVTVPVSIDQHRRLAESYLMS
ncbi:MAG TPA: hypothetical protein VF678_13190 [bacterium]